MKLIILSDYFEENVERYLKQYSKSNYNKSGIFYQQSIYLGFVKLLGEHNVKMFCCPTCGTFPNESRLLISPEFASKTDSIEYVGFNNVIYLRNIFRYFGLKKHLKKYLSSISKDEQILVLVIQMHYPFMKAFRYIKRRFPNASACINIWDFPKFVDFRNNNIIKKTLRTINYNKTIELLSDYDLYFYLSKGMDDLNPYKKKSIVHEGIISEEQLNEYRSRSYEGNKDEKIHIVFTGRLTKQEGILDLIDAVEKLKDENIILEIAGGGEAEQVVRELSQKSNRIIFHGLLNRDRVIDLQCRADLFVLPRLPEEYTNYSFPSKICEYIMANKPILTRPLKCFDSYLCSRFILLSDPDNKGLDQHLRDAISKIRDNSLQVDYAEFLEKNADINIAKEIVNALTEKN